MSTPGGSVETQTLPSPAELAAGVGPKGGAKQISCPAANDCWMVTTQGWIFHLATRANANCPTRRRPPAIPALTTFRPADEGVPQITPDAPPEDDSGEAATVVEQRLAAGPGKAPRTDDGPSAAALRTKHTRLIHGTTLELSFRLAVKSRSSWSQSKNAVVASTPIRTFKAGKRSLLLKLNRRLAGRPSSTCRRTHSPPLADNSRPRQTKQQRRIGIHLARVFPIRAGLLGWVCSPFALNQDRRSGEATQSARCAAEGRAAGVSCGHWLGVIAGSWRGSQISAGWDCSPEPMEPNGRLRRASEVEPTAQTDASVPSQDVTMIGSTPREAVEWR